jgi:hypothetical protein
MEPLAHTIVELGEVGAKGHLRYDTVVWRISKLTQRLGVHALVCIYIDKLFTANLAS